MSVLQRNVAQFWCSMCVSPISQREVFSKKDIKIKNNQNGLFTLKHMMKTVKRMVTVIIIVT